MTWNQSLRYGLGSTTELNYKTIVLRLWDIDRTKEAPEYHTATSSVSNRMIYRNIRLSFVSEQCSSRLKGCLGALLRGDVGGSDPLLGYLIPAKGCDVLRASFQPL
jgi:hypothetical protein